MAQNIYDQNRIELHFEVSRAIVYSLNLRKGTNYKKKIPLHDLIDDKKYSYDERFVAYVEMSDKIKEYLEYMIPYLNLENLSLEWTGQELIDECLRQHNIFVENTKTLEKVTMNIPDRLKEE